jgi:hypothetical protein
VTRAEFLATPRDYAIGPAVAPAAPSGGYGQPSLIYRLVHKLHGKYLVAAIAIGILVLLVVALGIGFWTRRRRRR